MSWSATEIDWKGNVPAAYTAAEQAEFQAGLDARVALLEPNCTQDVSVFCERWFREGNRFFVLGDGRKRIWFLFMRKSESWRMLFSFNDEAAADTADVHQQLVEHIMQFRKLVGEKLYWYPDNDTTGDATAFAAIKPLIEEHRDAGGKLVQKERQATRDFYTIEPSLAEVVK